MFRSNIKLYNLFKKELNLPDAKAEEFVSVLDEKIQVDIENAASKYKSIFKVDLTDLEICLHTDMAKTEKDLRGYMAKMEMNLRGDIAKLRGAIAQLELKIVDSKIEVFKCMMLIAFFALVLMIIGLYIK